MIGQHPSEQAAPAGGTVSFTVNVSSLATLYYQWQFNSNDIAGGTAASLTLSNVSTNSEGSYRVIVSNGAGTITSSNASFTLITPPVITALTQPDHQWVLSQGALVLSVTATAPATWASPLTYSWKTNGVTDTNATTGSYTVIGDFSTEHTFAVTITNAAGSTNTTWKVRVFQLGSVVGWGTNDAGQLERPLTLTNAIAAAAGRGHSLALSEDGTVTGWGDNTYGQTNIPAGLTNATAIAAGDNHNVALKSDGSVVAWGRNNASQTNVPTNLTNAIAIAAGGDQSLALLNNGTVTNWGAPFGSIPVSVTNIIALAAGTNFSVALRSNGTVIAWGNNSNGQTNVPGSATNVVAIAAGGAHALALKQNGTVVAWGSNGAGETNVPSGLTNAMGVAAGYAHSVALRNDGTVVGWGDNTYGQTNVGGGLTPIKSIASGGNHSLAVVFSSLVQYPVDVSKDLLLIYNTNSADSLVVKDYYLAHRPMVSGANVLGISYSNSASPGYYETITPTDLTNQIFTPVLSWLATNPTKRPQYVVLFLDVPSRVNDIATFPTNGMYQIGDGSGVHPSVSFQLRSIAAGWLPFITHLNMNGTNDCKAYIDKLASSGSNYSPGKLIISTSGGLYGNTNYVVDNVRYSGYSGDTVYRATNGLIAAGVSSMTILYTDGVEIAPLPHLTNSVNVAAYISWGFHSSLLSDYAVTTNQNAVKWTGNSTWWIIETVESHNGMRYGDSGTFLQWFSSNAFGGTNYSNTPVGAVSHVDEPGQSNVNDASLYFGLWAGGRNFGISAWNSQRTPFFQSVGDPFAIK